MSTGISVTSKLKSYLRRNLKLIKQKRGFLLQSVMLKLIRLEIDWIDHHFYCLCDGELDRSRCCSDRQSKAIQQSNIANATDKKISQLYCGVVIVYIIMIMWAIECWMCARTPVSASN